MKCKRHPDEQGAGVCASCLRDRLLALQAVQTEISPERHRRNPLPPALFPRSVSPYVSHRRSADPDTGESKPYHTPQISREKSHGCRRFPFLSLFHHHREPDESEASASWLSSLIHRRRKKKKKKQQTRPISSPPIRKVKSSVVSDRGMSPVREQETEDNGSESGYSTESSSTWRRAPAARRGGAGERCRRGGGGFVGFTVCLSPLVRPTGRSSRRNPPSEAGFSGELRVNGTSGHNRHVAGAGGSFGPNRSRKLADHGRFR